MYDTIKDAGLLDNVRAILVLSEDVPTSMRSMFRDNFMLTRDGKDGKRLIVFFKPKSIVNHDQNCGTSHKCYGRSKCVKFPYSTEEQCQCPSGYDGTLCSERSNITFSRTLDTLITESAKVPQLTDAYFEIQDAREEIRNGFTDVGKALLQMKNFIGNELGKISMNMNKLFEIASFERRYSGKLQDMDHAIRLSKPIFEIFKNGNSQDRKQAIKMAEEFTTYEKIPSWELTLKDMFNGQAGGFTLKHLKPLMVLVIDLFKKDACMPQYKEHIDHVYRHFLLLQSNLFMMHATALHILGEDTTEVGKDYKKRLKDQVCFESNIILIIMKGQHLYKYFV